MVLGSGALDGSCQLILVSSEGDIANTSAISRSKGPPTLMPTESTKINFENRWLLIAAISAAAQPPIEKPMMSASLRFKWSIRSRYRKIRSWRLSKCSGIRLPANPGWIGWIISYRSAKRSAKGNQSMGPSPPWSKRTGGPEPLWITPRSIPFKSIFVVVSVFKSSGN